MLFFNKAQALCILVWSATTIASAMPFEATKEDKNFFKQINLHLINATDRWFLLGNYALALYSFDNQGRNLLHVAVMKDRFDIARTLVDIYKFDVNAELLNRHCKRCELWVQTESLLHYAVRNNRIGMVKFLLSCKDIRVDERDENENTLLHKAIANKNEIIARLLIENKKELLNCRNSLSQTALHFAYRMQDAQLVALLISLDIDTAVKDIWGYEAVYYMQ